MKIRVLLFVLFILISVNSVFSADDLTDLSRESRYDALLSGYSEKLYYNPFYLTAYVSRAEVYVLGEKYDLAIKDYTTAINIKPERADLYVKRANVYYQKGDNKSGANDLVFARVIEGDNHFKKEEYDLAIKFFSEAVNLFPNYSIAYFKRGFTYLKKGEHNLAFEDFNKSIKLNPNNILAYRGRGLSNFLKRDYENAEADWISGSKLEKDKIKKTIYLLNIGFIYLNKENWDMAFSHSKEISSYNSIHPWNWLILSIAADKKGYSNEALEAYSNWERLKTKKDKIDLTRYLNSNLHNYLDSLP